MNKRLYGFFLVTIEEKIQRRKSLTHKRLYGINNSKYLPIPINIIAMIDPQKSVSVSQSRMVTTVVNKRRKKKTSGEEREKKSTISIIQFHNYKFLPKARLSCGNREPHLY